jgi:thiol-disulfide isomerase/thioredoxin
MTYLSTPVAYLVDSDFDSNGNLTNPDIPKDKIVFIMVQAGFCGHCTHAKPEFQKVADANKDKYFFATIQGDGSEKGEQELSSKLSDFIPGFRGFPEYVVYFGGKFKEKYEGGRKSENLQQYLDRLKL